MPPTKGKKQWAGVVERKDGVKGGETGCWCLPPLWSSNDMSYRSHEKKMWRRRLFGGGGEGKGDRQKKKKHCAMVGRGKGMRHMNKQNTGKAGSAIHVRSHKTVVVAEQQKGYPTGKQYVEGQKKKKKVRSKEYFAKNSIPFSTL